MSEIGWYTSQVNLIDKVTKPKGELKTQKIEEIPSFEIFQKAIEMVRKEHGGTFSSEISDRYGNKILCEFALVLPEFKRGIGIQIDEKNGTVNFVYDFADGYEKVVQDIIDEIRQCYTTIALIRAMKSMGYEVTEESPVEGKTVTLIGRI